ncbi:molybdopterin-dependent oxidoreductase [Microbacterium sp. SD291]|uniref:molybdopterin-dependent oxidoreductase n=1 Tax=Microbacterium sp. SD291 TaxID=2782007 RepID=UPI001A9708A3|nr:molybdopterin-dependent oxidoreductase [Microbacterium sp. SD291]MBO0980662.1 molybdopterin-dependent oxidoreductase [Microbacterium sp. SD291]
MNDRRECLRFISLASLAGLVSGAVFLATAEVVALIGARGASPILAVGSFVIDVVPQPVKEFAIATFGEYDKIILLASLAAAVLIASAIAGVLQYLRPPLGAAAFVVAGALSGAAIVTRAGAAPFAFAAPLLATVAGVIVVIILARRLRERRRSVGTRPTAVEGETGTAPQPSTVLGRRGFLLTAAIAGVSAAVAGVAARTVSAATSSVASIRKALRLPDPRTTVTVPDGAELDVPGLSPLYTPNADFYRVDTALTVPTIDPAGWRLVIDGMVDQRVEIGFDELIAMGLDEYSITLTCVSNEVGGGLVGSARWLGVPVRDLLRLAAPQTDADMVLSRSIDGFTASTPLSTLTDDGTDAILAVAMNGEPLPLEHGFPVRMVVPGLYGYVSATKWLTQLTVTTFEKDEAYWTPRGYSAQAPIKLSSRVDTPRSGKPVSAGVVPIAGVAWAQTVGIDRVEVQIDDGDWQQATLSNAVNEDTWVQWLVEWDATPGTHYVSVRATDREGKMQVRERTRIAPDGSTGWQRVLITVS